MNFGRLMDPITKCALLERSKWWVFKLINLIHIERKKRKIATIEKKTEKPTNPLSVKLGNFVYDDILKIKNKGRVILNLKKNGEALDEHEKSFVNFTIFF